MEKKKLSPVASGILNAVVSFVLIIAVYFVLSLIRKTPFTEKLSDPINIAIIILGPISAGISSWNKAKNKEAEKEKRNCEIKEIQTHAADRTLHKTVQSGRPQGCGRPVSPYPSR